MGISGDGLAVVRLANADEVEEVRGRQAHPSAPGLSYRRAHYHVNAFTPAKPLRHELSGNLLNRRAHGPNGAIMSTVGIAMIANSSLTRACQWHRPPLAAPPHPVVSVLLDQVAIRRQMK